MGELMIILILNLVVVVVLILVFQYFETLYHHVYLTCLVKLSM